MFLIYIITIIPIVVWGMMEPLGSRFSDFVTSMTSVGQILGLLGIMLFSINLILSGRLKIFDRYFKGLDKMYQHHQKIGVLAFSMMLFHPIFLVVKYLAISTREGALFFVPFINMPVTWGIISLAVFITLIVFTFYMKMKYHVWKISHKFMTIAFLFSVLHILFINSDISRNHILSTYIFIFAFLGLILSIRRAFLHKFIRKIKYRVVSNKLLNKDIREITLSPVSNKLNYKSGQFVFVNFINENITSDQHPFTISSSPSEQNLKFTIKNFGDFTDSVSNLKAGDIAFVEGPYGDFNYRNRKSKNQIWIAGGIGITPFLSMTGDKDKDYQVDLFYCVSENFEAVHLDQFEKVSKEDNNFKFHLWESKKSGYIDAKKIADICGGIKNKDIFICGPRNFMKNLENQFVKIGVDISRIHYEVFSL